MIIPLNSDAPIYHQPWGTIGIIACNVLVGVLWLSGAISEDGYLDWWVLPHGDGLTPVAWLTSSFAHSGFMHLVGNMVFLWAFGLIVEGKIGWQRFVPLYLGIGIAANLVEQILMLSASGGGSLGASGVISGLMLLSLAWAPRNMMDLLIFIVYRVWHVTWEVWVVAIWFIGWDFMNALWSGFGMSTPLLHLLGVLVTLPIAWASLHWRLVDCEGWDALTILKHGQPKSTARVLAPAPAVAEEPVDPISIQATALPLFRSYVHDNEPEMAIRVLRQTEVSSGPWALPAEDVQALIEAATAAGQTAIAREGLLRLEQISPDHRIWAALRRARLFIEVDHKPSAALKALQAIDDLRLSGPERSERDEWQRRAEALLADGVIEVMD